MKFFYNLPLMLAFVSATVSTCAQSITCDSFTITSLEPDTFDINNTLINIQMDGDFSAFANYPFISAVTDCTGDSIAAGGLFFFGQLGGTVQGYPVSRIEENACYPLTIEFIYGNDLFENDTCYLSIANSTTLVGHHNPMPWSIFPNPTNREVQIQSNQSILGETYKLYNIAGMLIQEDILNEINQRIDLVNIPAGYYTLYLLGTTTQLLKN
jgi:hypothetical protein